MTQESYNEIVEQIDSGKERLIDTQNLDSDESKAIIFTCMYFLSIVHIRLNMILLNNLN